MKTLVRQTLKQLQAREVFGTYHRWSSLSPGVVSVDPQHGGGHGYWRLAYYVPFPPLAINVIEKPGKPGGTVCPVLFDVLLVPHFE